MYSWDYTYPNGVETQNVLRVPAGQVHVPVAALDDAVLGHLLAGMAEGAGVADLDAHVFWMMMKLASLSLLSGLLSSNDQTVPPRIARTIWR